MTSLLNITMYVREKGLLVRRGTRSSAPKSSKQPPKTREPKQLRSWLVICGSDNVQDYNVADFSVIQSTFVPERASWHRMYIIIFIQNPRLIMNIKCTNI